MEAEHRILDPTQPDPSFEGLCALAVMTKAPRAGFVKTRLCPPLAPAEAAELNICFLRDTADAIGAACGGGARGIGAYTPAGSEREFVNILPGDFNLLLQRGDGFGQRLQNATADLFAVGFKSVCLIDSDSPTVPAEAYARAIASLRGKDNVVVIGPSEDGGYYLIGMNQLHEKLFHEIDWSTDRVLEQTQARATELGLTIEVLPTFYDVDDAAMLNRLRDELLSARNRQVAKHTRQFLIDVIRDRPL